MTDRSNPELDHDQSADLSHLPEGRLEEIQRVFQLLGIGQSPYSGPLEVSKKLQKASNLQYDGVIFTASDSTLSPPKR
jgi:hypothetical protein